MKPDPKHEAWLKYCDVLQFFESASFEMVFKAGWDARDKLGDEALEVAKEVMSTYDDQAVYKCQLEIQKLNEALKLGDEALGKAVEAMEYAIEMEKIRSLRCCHRLPEALAEIRKIMGNE